MTTTPEFTFVMPCLNEVQTIEICVEKCRKSAKELDLDIEVLIADNGSTDGSVALAKSLGCTVVNVEKKGYGSALINGIKEAKGKYVIMGDADDSYDFSDVSAFVDGLRSGADIVVGNRFKGGVEPGAMPPLHRYLGNPVLSFLGRIFYNTDIGDFHCGLRGLNKDSILGLGLQCPGMEFASEMLCKAVIHELKIIETPIKLYPDGRDRAPHLRSWRDGWRHLRFLLLHSPNWLFLYPGILLSLAGAISVAVLANGPVSLADIKLDVGTLVYSACAVVLGLQMATLGCFIKVLHHRLYALSKKPPVLASITMEKGLIAGGVLFLLGLAGSFYSINSWQDANYGNLNPADILRIVVPSVTFLLSGALLAVNSLTLGVIESLTGLESN